MKGRRGNGKRSTSKQVAVRKGHSPVGKRGAAPRPKRGK